MAGLSKDDDVEILTLPKPKSFFERFLGPVDPDSTALRTVAPALARKLGSARVLSGLLSKEPTLTVLPFVMDVK